jgi:hypothetical protein
MKNDGRTHVGVNVHRHVVTLQIAACYEVLEKHFEMNLHRA